MRLQRVECEARKKPGEEEIGTSLVFKYNIHPVPGPPLLLTAMTTIITSTPVLLLPLTVYCVMPVISIHYMCKFLLALFFSVFPYTTGAERPKILNLHYYAANTNSLQQC